MKMLESCVSLMWISLTVTYSWHYFPLEENNYDPNELIWQAKNCSFDDLFWTETSSASNYKGVCFKVSAWGTAHNYFCSFSQPAI